MKKCGKLTINIESRTHLLAIHISPMKHEGPDKLTKNHKCTTKTHHPQKDPLIQNSAHYFKMAKIQPCLKKHNLHSTIFNTSRPVSKIQIYLQDYVESGFHKVWKAITCFCKNHSTETMCVKILKDLMMEQGGAL